METGTWRSDLRSPLLLIAFAIILITRIAALPHGPWEFDEPLFLGALEHYQPTQHYPPPPGYPLLVLTGQAVDAIDGELFVTLAAINFMASLIGFVMLALAFRNISGNLAAGVSGALLFYLSPGALVHLSLTISDPGALALFATALYCATRALSQESVRWVVLFSISAAATVGWRPQFSVIVLPLFFVTLMLLRSWRARFIALGTFTIVCILWLIPLAMSVGGLEKLYAFETRQAEYLSAHDADQSRGNWSMPRIVARFIAHPWGPKMLALPILAFAAAGLWRLGRTRTRLLLPLAIAAGVYILFALAVMDPADGVRYTLPFTLFVALLAATGIWWAAERTSQRRAMAAVIGAYALASIAYVAPLLVERRSGPSPPMQAVAYAKTFPSDAVVLYDLPLWPHVRYYLGRFRPQRIDRALTEFVDRPDVPLYLFADGYSGLPGAKVFRWTATDAYSKLTRNHYRVVSVVALPPRHRFAPIRGVHAPERVQQGEEWRWLAPAAEVRLPRLTARSVRVRLGLPAIYPFDDNMLTIKVNGQRAAAVRVERGRSLQLDLPLTTPGSHVSFEAARSFVPAELPGALHRDTRTLSVQLYDIELR